MGIWGSSNLIHDRILYTFEGSSVFRDRLHHDREHSWLPNHPILNLKTYTGLPSICGSVSVNVDSNSLRLIHNTDGTSRVAKGNFACFRILCGSRVQGAEPRFSIADYLRCYLVIFVRVKLLTLNPLSYVVALHLTAKTRSTALTTAENE